MELRPYQEGALTAIEGWWSAGRQGEPMLICASTGAGKTVIFAELCKRLLTNFPGVSVLILAHRKELIEQTESKLKAVWPEAEVAVYAASLNRRETGQLMVASRDTIARVIDDIGHVTFLIIDEAHRISNKEEGRYRDIIHTLKAKYEHLVVIGFTATPYRLGQGKIYGKGKLFSDMAYSIGLRTLINDGHLVDYRFPVVDDAAVINTEGIKTIGGDFDEGELSDRATANGMVKAAVEDWLEQASDRNSSVFFCISILHAELVSDELKRHGVACPVVTGMTPMSERSDSLKRFAAGEFRAIANVGVLTEGWDCPRCDCIVLLRPTQSASLYVQMGGRGLRLFEGKTNCLIMDFGGNVQRLGKLEDATEPEPGNKVKGESKKATTKTCGTWMHGTGDDSGHWHDGCGCENAPAARECKQCHKPFFEHATKAFGTDAQGRKLKKFEVESITAMVCNSRSSGRDYVRVAYNCGLFQTFYQNVMLGYDGYAGEKAARQWARITGQWVTDVYSALEHDGMSAEVACFVPASVSHITVDLASKWKEITEVTYVND